jgi:Xaa-Pro aminopeptidase
VDGDATELEENMVLTLEPSFPLASGRGFVVTEEVITITSDGCRLLTARAPRSMPVVGAVVPV